MLIHVTIKASIRVERAACGNLATRSIAMLFESIVKHLKPLKTFTEFTKTLHNSVYTFLYYYFMTQFIQQNQI